MIRSLMYLSTVSCSDIAFAVSIVARYNTNLNQSHMNAVYRIYIYIRGMLNTGLHYSKSHKNLQLVEYVDSDHAECENTKQLTTDYLFSLEGSSIFWCLQQQKTVTITICNAEYVAASEAAKEVIWLQDFINHLQILQYRVTTLSLYIDNNAALKLTQNSEFHNQMKHIDIQHHFVRKKVQLKEINT